MIRFSVRLLVISVILLVSLDTLAQTDDRVMVVVAEGAGNRVIQRNTLRAIFGMRLRTWPDGRPVRVFVLPNDHPLHIAFCKQILNIYPHQLRLAWDRLIYSGTGQAPVVVSSPEEMYQRVVGTPGAVGYLRNGVRESGIDVLQIR